MSLPDVTPEFLAECERLDAAATPGPWTSNYEDAYEDDGETEVSAGWPDTGRMIDYGEYTMMRAEDSDFCVHARTALPALVVEVRALHSRAAHRALWRDAEKQQQRAESAESRAAELELQLAHEQTLRREAEERVAELEAALTWSTWIGANTPPRGITEERKNSLVLEAQANHRARVSQAQVNSGQTDTNARVAEAVENQADTQEPEEAEPPRCLAWMCQQDAEPGEEVCARHGGEAPLRASVEAAGKRGGR